YFGTDPINNPGYAHADKVVPTQSLMEDAVKDGRLHINDYKGITQVSPNSGGGWTDANTVAVDAAKARGVPLDVNGSNFAWDADGNPGTTGDRLSVSADDLYRNPAGAANVGEYFGQTGPEAARTNSLLD